MYVIKGATMAAYFEGKHGLMVVTSLSCDKDPHQNDGKDCASHRHLHSLIHKWVGD